jgi:prepilin-type N-terminal cleavage/methylation domain-containing protein
MRRRGFTLIETLVYIVVLALVLGVAYPAFYKCQRGSRDLQRNAEDILLTMRVGERWRQDVRAATGPIQASIDQFVIPQRGGEIVYTVHDGTLRRIANPGHPITVLSNVKSSAMQPDHRQQVNAWRWELELAGQAKTTRVRPLFSFVAVPGGPS